MFTSDLVSGCRHVMNFEPVEEADEEEDEEGQCHGWADCSC